MELEKTIVYFKASLKTNERVIKKLTSATNIKKYLEDEDLLKIPWSKPSRPSRWQIFMEISALHDRYLRIDHLQQPE